jgi:hypothetical protein
MSASVSCLRASRLWRRFSSRVIRPTGSTACRSPVVSWRVPLGTPSSMMVTVVLPRDRSMAAATGKPPREPGWTWRLRTPSSSPVSRPSRSFRCWPASARLWYWRSRTVMVKASPRMSCRRAIARPISAASWISVRISASWRSMACSSVTWLRWWACSARWSRARMASASALSISSGLPVARALTSLNDRAVSPMSLISREPRRPYMTWPMKRALRSRVCQE